MPLQKDVLMARVRAFIEENKISCPETIYQCDWVIENAYAFIEDCCRVVGFYEERQAPEVTR